MNYFDKITKRLVALSILVSIDLFLTAYVLRDNNFWGNLLLNLFATSLAATIALIFIGSLRYKATQTKTKPILRQAKSSISTTIYGTLLDLGTILSVKTTYKDFLDYTSPKEHQQKIDNLVKELKAIQHTKTDLDYDSLPSDFAKKSTRNIYEIDQIIQLYGFALPLDIKVSLLEVRDAYKQVEFALAISNVSSKSPESTKTVVAIQIHRLKMTVTDLHLLLNKLNVSESISLVDKT
jgi:hypothetical protein